MFTDALFLIFVLLILSFSASGVSAEWAASPVEAFLSGAALFCLLLFALLLQSRFFPKKRWELAAKAEIVLFLALFHLGLGGERLFHSILPAALYFPAICLFSFGLYFSALWLFLSRAYNKKHASRQLRLLAPFVVPFLLLAALFETGLGMVPTLLLFLVMAGALFLFFPAILQWAWQCRPLEESPLKASFDSLCQKAGFRHGGIRVWTVLDNMLTAGIIGVAPKFRYVMFTERLLRELPEPAALAVLAHEIGHSQRRHLFLLPLVLVGMVFAAGLAVAPIEPYLFESPFAGFAAYAVACGFYFRFIFGFYSRLFEREADLHGFSLGLAPEQMIDALDRIAVASGRSHNRPSWHHYSIRQRIDFLQEAAQDPKVIGRHHKKVKLWTAAYLLALLIAIGVFFGY